MSTEENESKAMRFFESIASDMRELLSLAKAPKEPAREDPPADPNRPRARKIKDPAVDPSADPVRNDPPADPPKPPDPQPPARRSFLETFLGK